MGGLSLGALTLSGLLTITGVYWAVCPVADAGAAEFHMAVAPAAAPPRRFDVLLYCNGMPVSIIELKKAGSATADVAAAHAQLQTYLREFPMAFRFCVFTLASDGIQAKYGTPFTPLNHFSPWNVDDDGLPVAPVPSLKDVRGSPLPDLSNAATYPAPPAFPMSKRTLLCNVVLNATVSRPTADVDSQAAAHLVLVPSVSLLNPETSVLKGMVQGWEIQQRVRFLKADTIRRRVSVVRRMVEFSNQHPWQWTAPEVEAFISSLSIGASPIALSIARSYAGDLRMFLEYLTDARYGWQKDCLERFGEAPRQILDE
jgi:hypothetical protein